MSPTSSTATTPNDPPFDGDGLLAELERRLRRLPPLRALYDALLQGAVDAPVWAVGGVTGSLVQHWDGGEWSEVDAPGIGQPLMGVWTAPGEDVWVAGNFGTTARWDGSAWDQPTWPLTP